jgi:hypothetical protein
VFQTHVLNVSSVFQTYVASFISGCFKSRSSVTSPSSLSPASPWCLLLAFYCLVSFLDWGAGAPGDGGADASALCPFVTRAGNALVHFFCYAEMLRWNAPIGGPKTRSRATVQLAGTRCCVRTCCWRGTSERRCLANSHKNRKCFWSPSGANIEDFYLDRKQKEEISVLAIG